MLAVFLFFVFNLRNLKVLYFYSGSFVSDGTLTINHIILSLYVGGPFSVPFTTCSYLWLNLTMMCLDMVLFMFILPGVC